MHGENATSQDAEQLVGDPPAQVIVAPEPIRPRLVTTDDYPLKGNAAKRQRDSSEQPSTQDGSEQRTDALPICARDEAGEQGENEDDPGPCEGDLEGIEEYQRNGLDNE